MQHVGGAAIIDITYTRTHTLTLEHQQNDDENCFDEMATKIETNKQTISTDANDVC